MINWVRAQAGRILIGCVLASNLLCAFLFLVNPEVYAPVFELDGEVGAAVVRGMGVLFLMWNVPYMVAFADPWRHRLAVLEAVIMQAVGLVGESYILANLPGSHASAHQAITRFIVFDLLGFIFLLLAAWLTRPNDKELPIEPAGFLDQ